MKASKPKSCTGPSASTSGRMHFHRTFSTIIALTASFLNSHGLYAQTQQGGGETVQYETDTVIAHDANGIEERASAMTVIHFNSAGKASFIGAVRKNSQGESVWVGKYGVDTTGNPENTGRLIYQAQSMPYYVLGDNQVFKYHLSYLELTTVGNDTDGYRAFAIKAVAADNKVEIFAVKPSGPDSQLQMLPEGEQAYELPSSGQVATTDGQLNFGLAKVRPNYDLTGRVLAPNAISPAKK